MIMNISSATDVGKIRENNQDCVAYKKIHDDELFLVLADGMGGHKGGEVASQMTVEYLMAHCSDHEILETSNDVKIWLNNMIHDVNKEVYEKGSHDESLEGMGTTVVIVYVWKDHLYISHVGDSRAYLFKDHVLKQLTVDDTLVNALLKNGYITREQAKNHPQKNVLIQAIGVTDLLNVSFLDLPTQFDDILMCSDGLYNSLSDEQITKILEEDLSVADKAQKLVDEANVYGGFDNISVILLEGGEA
jgi:protein phosphatase